MSRNKVYLLVGLLSVVLVSAVFIFKLYNRDVIVLEVPDVILTEEDPTLDFSSKLMLNYITHYTIFKDNKTYLIGFSIFPELGISELLKPYISKKAVAQLCGVGKEHSKDIGGFEFKGSILNYGTFIADDLSIYSSAFVRLGNSLIHVTLLWDDGQVVSVNRRFLN